MTCPHLDYRRADGDRAFDTERAFCTVVGEFVQPMRADICNDRYELAHATDCEIFLEQAGDGGGRAGPEGES